MKIALIAISFRVWMAVQTRTFFQPDEFFQSLEIAHRIVFGYGKLTWEWQPATAIRSITYPALYVPIYWILRVTSLDDTLLLVYAPKLLNGLFASLTDIWVCELTRATLGERYVSSVFLVSLTSFFHGISLTRSMSNSLETSLTVIALAFYPWKSSQLFEIRRIRKSLFFAALTCAIRPTAAVLWIYMFALLSWRLRQDLRMLSKLVMNAILLCIGFTVALIVADSAFYGKLTFAPLNFLLTNLSSISLRYGSNPWHYYISQGLPILCTTSLPFVIHGAYTTVTTTSSEPHDASSTVRPPKTVISSLKMLLGVVIWTISIYSLTGHKEWRFIHPLLPILHIFAAKSLVDLFDAKSRESNPTSPRSKFRSKSGPTLFQDLPILRSHLTLLILLPIIAVGYLTRYHSRAQIKVIDYLRRLPSEEIHSVGFLMPCHSTPWQAHLHKPELDDPGRLWALGCEPPVSKVQDISQYRDQTDVFYESPIRYLLDRFPAQVDLSFPISPLPSTLPGHPEVDWKHEWPKYLVVFGALLDQRDVAELLTQKMGYVEVWRDESLWEEDWRRRGGVRVLKIP